MIRGSRESERMLRRKGRDEPVERGRRANETGPYRSEISAVSVVVADHVL
jgi:hypothetical protein